MTRAVIAGARRTPVAPRGGFLAQYQADELAAPVLAQLVADARLEPSRIDHVILGNALYAGGNPARLAALRAGLPLSVPAMTIDTQCCSGLDAILMGIRMIEAGAAQCVLAGGTESFSRAPIRQHRPIAGSQGITGEPVAYDRPCFAPPPFADPDLAQAAADLATRLGITRQDQAVFAAHSHVKGRQAARHLEKRLVRIGDAAPLADAFTRRLQVKTALRAPLLAGEAETGLSAATIACEADGAAAVLLMSGQQCAKEGRNGLTVLQGRSLGGDTADPALVPNALGIDLLQRARLRVSDLSASEVMEAYAVQAMATAAHLNLDPATLNTLGGALARGHPIGASGAVLVVQLWETLATRDKTQNSAQKYGMALIAAAGGLASGLLVSA